KAAANVNRLMPRGLFSAAEGHILLPHPQWVGNLFNSKRLHCGKWLDKQAAIARIRTRAFGLRTNGNADRQLIAGWQTNYVLRTSSKSFQAIVVKYGAVRCPQ